MLAIVRAIERFHIYLYGIEFTVVTDCNASVYAINKANLNPRIAGYTLALQNYRFNVKHRAGARMAHVDALNRQVSYIDSLPLERKLEFKQLQDSKLKAIANELEFSDNEKFELINGLVYRKTPDHSLFVVHESMVNNLIKSYHDEMAHCGIEKTVQDISPTYWFPSLRKRIIYVDNCIICILANVSKHAKEGEMQLITATSSPFEILFVDHFGPLQTTEDGFRYLLVIVDSLTRFTWLFSTKSTNTKEVVNSMKFLFNIFGNPRELVSDRGSAFTSNEFTNFIQSRKIKHRQVAVASP